MQTHPPINKKKSDTHQIKKNDPTTITIIWAARTIQKNNSIIKRIEHNIIKTILLVIVKKREQKQQIKKLTGITKPSCYHRDENDDDDNDGTNKNTRNFIKTKRNNQTKSVD